MKTILDEILVDVASEIAAAKLVRPLADLRSRLADAPPVRPMDEVLASGFGLIAEIKERSPSVGPMREKNVAEALDAYLDCSLVKAVSVLTNATHFGMDIFRMTQIRDKSPKPVLRKDFILDEYQIREARAFGADAILLMANVLDAARLAGFYDLAHELEMEALFEVHELHEIALLPAGAKLVGINSRKFKAEGGFVGKSGASEKDFSLDFGAFELASRLPADSIKIAESGLSPSNIREVRKSFHAALVGTSLLRDPRGPVECLREFEEAVREF